MIGSQLTAIYKGNRAAIVTLTGGAEVMPFATTTNFAAPVVGQTEATQAGASKFVEIGCLGVTPI